MRKFSISYPTQRYNISRSVRGINIHIPVPAAERLTNIRGTFAVPMSCSQLKPVLKNVTADSFVYL
jgi:hypothetical protein